MAFNSRSAFAARTTQGTLIFCSSENSKASGSDIAAYLILVYSWMHKWKGVNARGRSIVVGIYVDSTMFSSFSPEQTVGSIRRDIVLKILVCS